MVRSPRAAASMARSCDGVEQSLVPDPATKYVLRFCVRLNFLACTLNDFGKKAKKRFLQGRCVWALRVRKTRRVSGEKGKFLQALGRQEPGEDAPLGGRAREEEGEESCRRFGRDFALRKIPGHEKGPPALGGKGGPWFLHCDGHEASPGTGAPRGCRGTCWAFPFARARKSPR